MKPLHRIILIPIIAGLLVVPLVAKSKASAIEVRQITPADSEVLEEWVRVTTEEDVLGVDATRSEGKWAWTVFICAAEFVREDPLASRLVADITAALKKVKGVTAVVREDTEVWLVQGHPTGTDLVRACSHALDRLAPDLRKDIERRTKVDPRFRRRHD